MIKINDPKTFEAAMARALEDEMCRSCVHLEDPVTCDYCDGPTAANSKLKVVGTLGELKMPKGQTAASILHDAANIMEERGRQYDKPEGERSMGTAVEAFNTITGRDLRESEGWLLLQILKDVRDNQKASAHEDSLLDCVAYAALKAEARLAGK